MSEKTNLLPKAPTDFTSPSGGGPTAPPASVEVPPQHTNIRMDRIVIVPGLEFDPNRKSRYGLHSLCAAVLVLISFILVELRDCEVGPGIDLDKLQALHISLMVFAFVLYLMSMCGIADFIFQYKFFFFFGVILVYTFTGLMIWMTYEAVMNPCVKVFTFAPIDFTPGQNKNVFSRGDAVGIIVFILDVLATLCMFSAASNFYKRY